MSHVTRMNESLLIETEYACPHDIGVRHIYEYVMTYEDVDEYVTHEYVTHMDESLPKESVCPHDIVCTPHI